jgi:preprotein translocase SecF subunit
MVYDTMYYKKLLRPLNFLHLIRKPKLDYMKLRKFTYTFSVVMVLLGIFAFVQLLRGQGNIGVDFAGGSLLQYQASQSYDLQKVRQVFAQSDLHGVDLQPVTSENRLIIKIKKSEQIVGKDTATITAFLNEKLPEYNFSLESQSEIGASVSDTLKEKALQAILISMAGVVIYIALRFDYRFGMAAAIATFHDVILVLGVCWLLNIEITLLIVTALLTLAGYSLNDTVIVFDRVRENMRKQHESSWPSAFPPAAPLPWPISCPACLLISRCRLSSCSICPGFLPAPWQSPWTASAPFAWWRARMARFCRPRQPILRRAAGRCGLPADRVSLSMCWRSTTTRRKIIASRRRIICFARSLQCARGNPLGSL